MCNSNKCKTCGKDIGGYIEHGLATAISHEGDGYVCNSACKKKYDARKLVEYDALANPATNLCDLLGVSRSLDVGDNAAFC